jgi:hypothetical protein
VTPPRPNTARRLRTGRRAAAGIAVLLTAALLVPAVTVAPRAAAEDPVCALDVDDEGRYIVVTAADLAKVGQDGCALSASYCQAADIVLTGEWTPIGTFGAAFTGTYDGSYRTISGLSVDRGVGPNDNVAAEQRLGLFGQTGATSVIRNVGLVDVFVRGTIDVGGLVGFHDGTIENSYVTGSVTGVKSVGGFVAASVGTIRNSYSLATVTAYDRGGSVDAQSVGGIVGALGGQFAGFALGVVEDSYAAGPILYELQDGRTSSTTQIIGGLAGFLRTTGSVVDSFWDTEVTGRAESAAGTGKSTAEMQTAATFTAAGWDTDVWTLTDGSYPKLWWETDPSDPPCEAVEPPAGGGGDEDDGDGDGDGDGNGGGGSSSSDGGSTTPASWVPASGVAPQQSPGSGQWQQADGSSVPLRRSSPGTRKVRYQADGLTVTLTGSTGTGADRGLVVDANGQIECEVCAQLASGGVIEAWMFSTPRLVAAQQVAGGDCQSFTIPVAAPLDGAGAISQGAHTLQLALPTASGMQAVNVGVTVGSVLPTSLPAGEGSPSTVRSARGCCSPPLLRVPVRCACVAARGRRADPHPGRIRRTWPCGSDPACPTPRRGRRG